MRIIIILLLLILSHPAHARVLSGRDLVEDAQFYDGAKIEFEGEVIGDLMLREDFAWINVSDGTRAIGVWAPKKLIKNINITGDYNHIGDKIHVQGTFNRACGQHGGDLDIHADQIYLVKKGDKVAHPIEIRKVLATVVLLFMVVGVLYLPKILKVRS